MESLTAAAARALAAGDPLAALKRIALRDDPVALALRGIAMAQLGDFERARQLLRNAARAFGPHEPTPRARCALAEAEIALVSRELGGSLHTLGTARTALEVHGDWTNAAHAGYLEARCLLLIGRLDECERTLAALAVDQLPRTSRAGYWLVVAGAAMRRIRAAPARVALDLAMQAAQETGIPALATEVKQALCTLNAPAARLITRDGERLLELSDVEELLASNALLIDACRNVARAGTTVVHISGRPVLFALARMLAEAWPGDVSREEILARVFRARHIDESHRGRLRVEIARLRKMLHPLAGVHATKRGFVLEPHSARTTAVLAPPVEDRHARVLSLLADDTAWSSSALALALGVSPRTVQRALETLAETGKVESFGHGRARRWVASNVPGFPPALLLPAPLAQA